MNELEKNQIVTEITTLVATNKKYLIPAIREKIELAKESLIFHVERGNENHVRKELDTIYQIVWENL